MLVDMNRTFPLLVALLVTAMGCECQERTVRRSPIERVEVSATGLLSTGDGAVDEVDYNPPVYRIRQQRGGQFNATMTLGWGAIELLLPDGADANDPTRYSANVDDAFALVMTRTGMASVDTERTLVAAQFDHIEFKALLGRVEYLDPQPQVRFAIDLATGALTAEVEGTLVASDKDDVPARRYRAQFDAIGKVQCFGAEQDMSDPPEWDSEAPSGEGACADLLDHLDQIEPTDDTPAQPWSMNPGGDDMVCGSFG